MRIFHNNLMLSKRTEKSKNKQQFVMKKFIWLIICFGSLIVHVLCANYFFILSTDVPINGERTRQEIIFPRCINNSHRARIHAIRVLKANFLRTVAQLQLLPSI